MPSTSRTRRFWFQFGMETILLLAALIVVSALALRERGKRREIERELTNWRAKAKQQDVDAIHAQELLDSMTIQLQKLQNEQQ